MNKIINSNHKILFLSATPRDDIMKIMKITDIYRYNWERAISNHYICNFTIHIPDMNENFDNIFLLINAIDTLNNKQFSQADKLIIIKTYFMLRSLLYNGDKKCICYMTDIEKANKINSVLK